MKYNTTRTALVITTRTALVITAAVLMLGLVANFVGQASAQTLVELAKSQGEKIPVSARDQQIPGGVSRDAIGHGDAVSAIAHPLKR